MNDCWFWTSRTGPCAEYGDNTSKMAPCIKELIENKLEEYDGCLLDGVSKILHAF